MVLSAAMAVFMFSLAGIPPTAGCVGKFYIFSAAVKAGYVGLAIIGLLNSALSVYFYLRVTVMMYCAIPKRNRPGAWNFRNNHCSSDHRLFNPSDGHLPG